MKVKITDKSGWMGSPKGTVVEVSPFQAEQMVFRGVAESVEIVKSAKSTKPKKVMKPAKDKMVKKAKNK